MPLSLEEVSFCVMQSVMCMYVCMYVCMYMCMYARIVCTCLINGFC